MQECKNKNNLPLNYFLTYTGLCLCMTEFANANPQATQIQTRHCAKVSFNPQTLACVTLYYLIYNSLHESFGT